MTYWPKQPKKPAPDLSAVNTRPIPLHRVEERAVWSQDLLAWIVLGAVLLAGLLIGGIVVGTAQWLSVCW